VHLCNPLPSIEPDNATAGGEFVARPRDERIVHALTPVVFFEVPATRPGSADIMLRYGHLPAALRRPDRDPRGKSGSPELLACLDALHGRLGRVGLVVCLDSGAGNDDPLWLTTSLRGMVSGVLKVEVLAEGVPQAASRSRKRRA